MEKETKKTFEQEVTKLDIDDEKFTGSQIKTSIYPPGLVSEDGKATIRELMLIALAKAFAQQTIAEHNGDDLTTEQSNQIIDNAVEEVEKIFAKAAHIHAMEQLQYMMEHTDELYGSVKELLGFGGTDE